LLVWVQSINESNKFKYSVDYVVEEIMAIDEYL